MDRKDSKLVIRDVPILLWLFGVVFVCVGAVIVYEGGKAPYMGLVFLAIGLGIVLFTSVLTITADRNMRTLKLEYRSILRHKVKDVDFDQIAAIEVQRSTSSNRQGGVHYTYQVAVTRKDGQVIPFHSYSSTGSKRKQRLAGRLRDFIGIQNAASQPRMPEIHQTDGIRWQIQPVNGSNGARWHSPDFTTPGVFLFLAQKAEGQASGGFLASLGSMFFKSAISMYGFTAIDTPGLDQAVALTPLAPDLERHFMAFTNSPDSTGSILNSKAVTALADWARRYPLKQFQKDSSQLVMLFGPNGAYVAALKLFRPEQVNELSSLGLELVRSQGQGLH